MAIRWNPAGIIAVLFISFFAVYLFRETISPLIPSVFLPFAAATRVSLKSVLCASVIAAHRGGVEVKRIHDAQLLNAKNKDQATNNPVTDGDLRSHHVMYRTLTETFPGLKVISEEHGDNHVFDNLVVGSIDGLCPDEILMASASDQEVFLDDLQLWIDPLDATQEYTENLLHYVTTMVGMAVKGVAVGGVIHKPFATDPSETTFWAYKDFAISRNLESSRSQSSHPDLKIIVSRSHGGDVEEVARSAFQGRTMEVTPAGGAGFKTLEVLAGRASVYLHTTKIKKWDLCAPNGLLNALGGKLTTLEGKAIDYSASWSGSEVNKNGVVAALVDHERYIDVFRDLKNSAKPAREDS